MRKPNESVDDHIVRPTVAPKPPRAVALHRTGGFELLRPLTPLEVKAETARNGYTALRPPNPLWFRRLLAVGSGALVIIAFALVSAILVGINDSTVGPD